MSRRIRSTEPQARAARAQRTGVEDDDARTQVTVEGKMQNAQRDARRWFLGPSAPRLWRSAVPIWATLNSVASEVAHRLLQSDCTARES